MAVAAPALLALVAAPFVLARAFGGLAGWQDLWKPTLAFGVGTLIAAIVGSALGEGLGQFLPVGFAWIAVLAVRMLRLTRVERGGGVSQRQPTAA